MQDNEFCLVEAREKFTGLIEYVKQAVDSKEAIHKVEYHLFRALLSLGFSMLVYFIKQQGLGDTGRYLSLKSGQILLQGKVKVRSYLSIFGEIKIARYVYGQGKDQKAPLDGQLALPAWKYSYLLQDWGLCLSSQHAFSEAGKLLDKILGIGLSVRSLERLSCKVSEDVEAFRVDQPIQEAQTETLVVATSDCKGVPLTQEKKPVASRHKRRKKGEKPNKKKMACVGAVYNILPFVRTTADIIEELQEGQSKAQRPRPWDKHLRADLMYDKETTFAWMAEQVKKRNPQARLKVICLMDGEKRLWALKAQYLPEAVGILDLWHVSEYLWKGAYVFHKEGSDKAQRWVKRRLTMLLEGKADDLIADIKQRLSEQGITGKKKKTLESILTYFTNNRAYMHYDQYLAAGYPIGSGVAEGACRHLVKDRMECSGMRWTLEGAQAILDLRASYINEDWEAFWTHYTTAEKERLYGPLNIDNSETYRATG